LERAGGIGGLLARSHGYSGGTWSTHNFYQADGNGNITYMVNSSQSSVAAYKYDPFGNLISSSGSLAGANVYRFSSKEQHANSGMYYYGYRFYDPNLQRWINRDPIEEAGGINLYAFVQHDPLNFTDSFGLSPCSDFAKSLIRDYSKSESPNALGDDWLHKRSTTLKDAGGFKDNLTAGGQGGAVSRHIYGHGGAVLKYDSGWPFHKSAAGAAASYLNEGIDFAQRFQKGRTKAESEAEIADDRAARAIADILRDAYRQRSQHPEQPSDLKGLLDKLTKILCK